MDFTTAVSTCLSKYAEFQGRARRSEYWYFVLFNILLSIGIQVLGALLFGFESGVTAAVSGLVSLALLLPGLGVTIRRLHDTGRSGWWVLIAFVPVVGFIVLIVFNVQDSEAGTNDWGPNPKGTAYA